MKLKTLLFSILAIAFFACDDDWDSIGMGILPDDDIINTFSDTVYIDAVTVKLDSIYAKTIYGTLGSFYDPVYGYLESGYICQFYPPEIAFPDSIIDNKIDSVTLSIGFFSFTGDSLTPMEVSVYPVVKDLQKDYYSTVNPSDYCDMNTLYGRKAYTVRDMNISDSLYEANSGIVKWINLHLPIEIGESFINEFKKPEPNAFSELESFTDFFKGLYIKSTFGTGCMLDVSYSMLTLHFKMEETAKDQNGEDSVYISNARTNFFVTKEIIQLNEYNGSKEEHLLKPNDEAVYVKSPSGICTKLIIPIPEIAKRVENKTFNNVRLSLTAYEKNPWEYSLARPSNLLLINPDSVKNFFENQKLYDGITTFSTSRSGDVYSFVDGSGYVNISNVIQNAIENAPDENLELLVVPVNFLQYYDSYYGYISYATNHYLSPSGISFKKGKEYLKLEMFISEAK